MALPNLSVLYVNIFILKSITICKAHILCSILYIHDFIYSLVFEILYANEKTKIQSLTTKATQLGFELECIWLQSHSYILHFSHLACCSHALCSHTELLSVPFKHFSSASSPHNAVTIEWGLVDKFTWNRVPHSSDQRQYGHMPLLFLVKKIQTALHI